MSRPETVTDFSTHVREPLLGRIRCVPADTPLIVKRPSLSTRAFDCGPKSDWSVEGAVILNCVTSGAGEPPGRNDTVPLIVAPADSTTFTSGRSSPLTLIGWAANCGVSESHPRARRM